MYGTCSYGQWGGDVNYIPYHDDDVVAICMAHALMDNGEVMSIIFFMMMMLITPMMISHKLMYTDLIEHCQENE